MIHGLAGWLAQCSSKVTRTQYQLFIVRLNAMCISGVTELNSQPVSSVVAHLPFAINCYIPLTSEIYF